MGDYKHVVLDSLEEIWNKGNDKSRNRFFHEHWKGHDVKAGDPTHPVAKDRTLDQLMGRVKSYRNAFAGLKFTAELCEVCRDRPDWVVLHWSAVGRFVLPLVFDDTPGRAPAQRVPPDMQPTGQHFRLHGITLSRFEDNLIVEDWLLWDTFGLFRYFNKLEFAADAEDGSSWQSEWSRHFDQIQWTAISIMMTGNVGLVAFTIAGGWKAIPDGSELDKSKLGWDLLGVLGIALTLMTTFYAASFRRRRFDLHSQNIARTAEGKYLASRARGETFSLKTGSLPGQWRLFMLFHVLLAGLYVTHVWLATSGLAILIAIAGGILLGYIWYAGSATADDRRVRLQDANRGPVAARKGAVPKPDGEIEPPAAIDDKKPDPGSSK